MLPIKAYAIGEVLKHCQKLFVWIIFITISIMMLLSIDNFYIGLVGIFGIGIITILQFLSIFIPDFTQNIYDLKKKRYSERMKKHD